MQGREVLDRTFLFADLFPSGQGAASIPGSVMASVMTLQTLHDYSDRETAEAVRCDLRWKVACGLALDDVGFHPTALVYRRRRLAKSDRPHRINDVVKSVITQTGVLHGRRRRPVDSTILADAVATQDTITQLIAAVRRVARTVPGAAELVASGSPNRYRGTGKNNAWLKRRTAALNLRNLIGRGLHRMNGTWIVATT